MVSLGTAKLIVIATFVSLNPDFKQAEAAHNTILCVFSATFCIIGIIFAYILFQPPEV